MPRPTRCRRVGVSPKCDYFKPQGVRLSALDVVSLTVDELEAIRLADLQGHYQQCAAEKMGVSRQTFGRIVESAHKKIADALVHGKALSIEGGEVEVSEEAVGRGRAGHGPGRRNRGRCCGRSGRGRGHE